MIVRDSFRRSYLFHGAIEDCAAEEIFMRHDIHKDYEHFLCCIHGQQFSDDLKCSKTDSNTLGNIQTLLDRVEGMVQEIQIINPRSTLVPLRGKKLGKAGERQEEIKAIVC